MKGHTKQSSFSPGTNNIFSPGSEVDQFFYSSSVPYKDLSALLYNEETVRTVTRIHDVQRRRKCRNDSLITDDGRLRAERCKNKNAGNGQGQAAVFGSRLHW